MMFPFYKSILAISRMSILLIGLALILLAGCAGQPFEPDAPGEMLPGPGVFSGEDGEFTLYKSKDKAKGRKKEKEVTGITGETAEAKEFQEFQEWKKETREFKEFQEWKKTMRDSEEYQEFLEYRKWKKYKEWEKSKEGSQ